MEELFNNTNFAVLAIAAYLIGAIPFGIVVARMLGGTDPRSKGSGNIGATNVARTSGKAAGALTLLLDVVKGALPVIAVKYLFGYNDMGMAFIGLAAFSGHIFPVYLKFRGGKGVATASGVFLATIPVAFFIGAGVFFLIVMVTRYVSLGSVTSSLSVPIAAFLLGYDSWYVLLGAAVFVLISIKHVGNIQRLLSGTENRFK